MITHNCGADTTGFFWRVMVVMETPLLFFSRLTASVIPCLPASWSVDCLPVILLLSRLLLLQQSPVTNHSLIAFACRLVLHHFGCMLHTKIKCARLTLPRVTISLCFWFLVEFHLIVNGLVFCGVSAFHWICFFTACAAESRWKQWNSLTETNDVCTAVVCVSGVWRQVHFLCRRNRCLHAMHCRRRSVTMLRCLPSSQSIVSSPSIHPLCSLHVLVWALTVH